MSLVACSKLLTPTQPLAKSNRLQAISQHIGHSRHYSSHSRPRMTQKSYSNGSEFPPLKPGVLRIYSMRFCPWAERTRLVLEHKKIPYETVNIDLKNKPDWFFKKNPLGLVPVLEIDDKIVYESTATSDWLDDVYPDNRLQPSDPYRKAWDRILVEYYGKFASTLHSAISSIDKKAQIAEDFQKHFKFFENVLKQRKGPFFGDEKPAMVDLLIWPHFERIPVFATLEPSIAIDKGEFPRLTAWFEAVQALPAAKATAFDVKTHLQFFDSFKTGKPVYDIGLEE